VALPGVRYPTGEKQAAAVEALERRIREAPGVEAVGASARLPLRGYFYTGDATPEGRAGDDYERELRNNLATPGYFRAVGATILKGRAFTEADAAGKEPVTIVNAALERSYFRGEDALGKRIRFARPQDDAPWVTIVGVVADQQQDGLDRAARPEAFSPFAQDPTSQVSIVVRGQAGTEALAGAGRRAVRAIDPDLAVTDLAPLADLVGSSLVRQRFRTLLVGGFAGVALLLAGLGVYGVLAYAVTRRTRELGVRLAVGASRAKLFAMVLRDGIRPVAWGAAAGLPLAYGGAVLARSLLFGVAPGDVATYALTSAATFAVAVLGSILPAARALRVDPAICLRDP
jgi:putative ABC transport system permease protein